METLTFTSVIIINMPKLKSFTRIFMYTCRLPDTFCFYCDLCFRGELYYLIVTSAKDVMFSSVHMLFGRIMQKLQSQFP